MHLLTTDEAEDLATKLLDRHTLEEVLELTEDFDPHRFLTHLLFEGYIDAEDVLKGIQTKLNLNPDGDHV